MISSVRHRKEVDTSTPVAYDLAFREYWRDDRDRIVAWKRGFDTTHNPMENGRGNRYQYYDDGQLERAWYRAENPETESPGTPARGDHFYYDAMGNRVGWNEVASRGSMLFQGKSNGLNQYFSWENNHPDGDPQHWGTRTNYDDDVGGEWGAPGAANGVLMQDGYITAGYNALNQPIKMWGKSYFSTDWMWFGYDPLGRLVKRWKSSSGDPNTTSATFFYYDGSSLVQEGPAAGLVDRVYVHGGRIDEIVASWGSGVWYNHHYDAQGSCILLSNTSGGIEQQYDYDAFGFPYFYTASGGKGGSPKTRFLFTGREWIVDMRIYDYRARMYQPELGRFLQPDPVEFAASDYNLYRYCHNDPVNKSDPTGMREQIAVEIMRDRMWDMACRMDSGNSLQGESDGFPNGHDHTAMGTHKVADGNYDDTNMAHHIRDQKEGGVTELTFPNKDRGDARPTINWWVNDAHKGDQTILGELEHTSRNLWSAEFGPVSAAIKQFNANPHAPQAQKKLENARLREKITQTDDIHGSPNRHDLNTNPKLWIKMTPGQIDDAIRSITPMEDPRPHYLGF
jgi:RHS repeat-associated protein